MEVQVSRGWEKLGDKIPGVLQVLGTGGLLGASKVRG